MAANTNISDAEWQVMEAVWSMTPPAASAQDVIQRLQQSTNWTDKTIKTMLNRLVNKGALIAEADGRRYLYLPAVTRERCVKVEGKSFLQRVFGGEEGAMLAHFARNAELSAEEIAQLKAILDQKASKDAGSGRPKA